MTRPFLPYGKQHIDDDDIAAVVAALRSDYLTTGPTVDELERAFAQAVSARHAVVCMNGTAALHLAGLAVDLRPGDYAIVPAITFLATANAIVYAGAEPVFCDVDPKTGRMDATHLQEAIARCPAPPKAILPVHLGGGACDMPAIAAIAHEHGAAIIEDACHALGTAGLHNGERYSVGDCRWSTCSVFSLHPVKMMTMGEGGIITTNDDAHAARMRRLRNHGMVRSPEDFLDTSAGRTAAGAPNPWYYEMQEIGYNYRATDLQCALGLSQLRKLGQFIAKRQALVSHYRNRIEARGTPGLSIADSPSAEPVGWHLFRVTIDFGRLKITRADLMKAMADRGVGSQVHYIPLHHQPYYKGKTGSNVLPGAERYYESTLSLPLYPGMTEADVDHVVDILHSCLHEK